MLGAWQVEIVSESILFISNINYTFNCLLLLRFPGNPRG